VQVFFKLVYEKETPDTAFLSPHHQYYVVC